jgi:hypothetical protein
LSGRNGLQMPIRMPAHKNTEHPGGQVRGVLSDNAQTLSDVISRVEKAESIHKQSMKTAAEVDPDGKFARAQYEHDLNFTGLTKMDMITAEARALHAKGGTPQGPPWDMLSPTTQSYWIEQVTKDRKLDWPYPEKKKQSAFDEWWNDACRDVAYANLTSTAARDIFNAGRASLLGELE